MPELVRLYIRQCLIGFAIAGAFVAVLMGLDVAGLRGLILATSGGWIALLMLWFFNGLVFAGVQFAITVMGMAEGPQRPGPGARLGQWAISRHSGAAGEAIPVAVKAGKGGGPAATVAGVNFPRA